ncbi:unnamed protein product [Soboliphyme baturini]|uniref:MSP domain-containing protein n=1 Tax=Soboliphyme baturini TaxID=241478 RepID=A0A183IES0_9BILA|nr:unnamed protein product [Soboliphyme baturini]
MPRLRLEPSKRLFFNAPFLTKQKAALRLTNDEYWPIMYRIKCTSPRRYLLDKWTGALGVGDSALHIIRLLPLNYREGMWDRFTIEYCRVPSERVVAYDEKLLEQSDVLMQKSLRVCFHV